MLDQKLIVYEITRIGQMYFPQNGFFLEECGYNCYRSTGTDRSNAINNVRNSRDKVTVIKWFNDFWLFVEIKFILSEVGNLIPFFSLSVFQGDRSDKVKNQLFRAEWDSYDDNREHPQPHWHFCSIGKIEKIFDSFKDSLNSEDTELFNVVNEDFSKGIDINEMHFAMNALWSTNNGHIHNIDSEIEFINWFKGLLGHLKTQLEFVK